MKIFLAVCCVLGALAQNPDFPPTTKATNEVCGSVGLDLVFVIDVSGSITQPNFDQMMLAVRDTVKTFPIGDADNQTHVGVVTFSSSATQIFGLDAHTTNADLDDALSKVPYTEGGTNIESGMRAAIDMFAGSGNRPDVPDVMVVITDGQDGSNVRQANLDATAQNITVFAVGVGNSNNLDLNQLGVVTGNPNNVFVSTNFTFLNTVLKEKVCQSIVESVQAQTTPIPIAQDKPQPTTTTQNVALTCDGANEVFDGCGGCEASCGNFSLNCIQQCDVKNARCRCQNGFVRDSKGLCVTPDECCAPTEVFDACGGCEEQCGQKRLNCVDGCDFTHARCRCRRGLARDDSGLCIARDGCANKQQPPFMPCAANEIRRCSTSCEGTCGNPTPSCIFNAPVRPRCRFQRCECPVENGFVRDHFGRCFSAFQCPGNNPFGNNGFGQKPGFFGSGFNGRPHGHRPHGFHGHRSSSSESGEGFGGNGGGFQNSGNQNNGLSGGQNSGMGGQGSGMGGGQNSGMGGGQSSGMGGGQNSGMGGGQGSGMIGGQNSGMGGQGSGMGGQNSGSLGQGSGISGGSTGQNVQLDKPNAQGSGAGGGGFNQDSHEVFVVPNKIIIINKPGDNQQGSISSGNGSNSGKQQQQQQTPSPTDQDQDSDVCKNIECDQGFECKVHCHRDTGKCRPRCMAALQ